MEKQKFTKNTTIGEVLEKHPNAEAILTGFGLHCFSCPMSQMETLEEACIVHGVHVEFMLDKLNK